MATYVIIDTCIYRQLGLKFHENLDYKNLCGFLVATDNELLVSEIVVKELVGYYDKQIENKISNYENSINAILRDPHFKIPSLKAKNLNKEKKRSIESFRKYIIQDPNHGHDLANLPIIDLPSLEIVDFIIDSNKNNVTDVQIRDYLLWISILLYSKEESIERIEKLGNEVIKFEPCNVAFITNDKGFTTNELFTNKRLDLGVKNLDIYNSIPEFLNKYGYNVPFLTKELIKSYIIFEDIKEGLLPDSNCFLSYISPRYNTDESENRKIIKFDILDYEIIEFYSYKENEKSKYVAHLKVFINLIYEADKELTLFPSHLLSRASKKDNYLETYNSEGQPIFNAPILFMVSGDLDIKKECLVSKKMIDFLPFVYI